MISILLISSLYRQAIRHEKLNLPNNPCETSPDYNFGQCVDRSVIMSAGCQPPWSSVNVEDIPFCANHTELKNHAVAFLQHANMGLHDLSERSKCMLPCSFIEYEVKVWAFPIEIR